MLIVLLVLAIAAFVSMIAVNSFKNNSTKGGLYKLLILVQSGSIGATVGLLVVLLLKGRSIG
ncbi:hypothetical protein ACYSNW_12290 [Enterococcus sp. LJL99]